MENIILDKDAIIKILKGLERAVTPHHTSETGAHSLWDIHKILTLLDCGIRNILEFALIQQRIICLFKGTHGLLDTTQNIDSEILVENLEKSMDLLEIYAKREIRGQSCYKEYVEYGFEIVHYYSEYLKPREKNEETS